MINIKSWVEKETNSELKQFRQAIHTILYAIANSQDLKDIMIMKGGILLAIQYNSSRYTRDIDFSTSIKFSDFDKDSFLEKFENSLVYAIETLDYDLDCKVQSHEVLPSNKPNATTPTFRLKIGYAEKGSNKHKRLLAKNSPNVVQLDYSFNEITKELDTIKLTDFAVISTYGLVDLVAEKFRAMLQQEVRKRARRQDVYDLYFLIKNYYSELKNKEAAILNSLIEKAASRQLEVEKNSLAQPAIRNRSKLEYPTLKDEIEGELPDFDEIYNEVNNFYESLPW